MSRSAVILAGGRSSRMGADKATLPFGESTLLETVASRCAELCDEVIVVAREDQRLPGPWRIVHDSGNGPLDGIAAGLRAASHPYALVTACDTPLLQPAVVELLFERANGHAAAVCEADGRIVATLGAYAATLGPVIEALLASGERRARAVANLHGVVVVPEADLRAADSELLSLRGCNTPEEYQALLDMAGLSGAAVQPRAHS